MGSLNKVTLRNGNFEGRAVGELLLCVFSNSFFVLRWPVTVLCPPDMFRPIPARGRTVNRLGIL